MHAQERMTESSGFYPEVGMRDCTMKVRDLMSKLDRWDFERVRGYCLVNGFYTVLEIDAVEREYKRYIALGIAYPDGTLPISAKIDDFWHTHVLFTKDYMAFGQWVCGRYIHHMPTVNQKERDELREGYVRLLSLYAMHFGTSDPLYWPDQAQVCGGNGGNNGCDRG